MRGDAVIQQFSFVMWTCAHTPFSTSSFTALLGASLLSVSNCSNAMTTDEFARFLAHPPPHGHAVVLKVTPLKNVQPGESNTLAQVFEYAWNGMDVFSILRENELTTESGVFTGIEWDHVAGHLTKYAGTNQNDSLRRRSALNGGFADLCSLGVWYLVKGTARWDGSLLDAEIDMPSVREKTGHNPRLLGELRTLADGTVSRLEYSVNVLGQSFQKYAINYRFGGSWGKSFPSYFAVYRYSSQGSGTESAAPELCFEAEIRQWDVSAAPAQKELDPGLVLGPLEVNILSNNILYNVSATRLTPILTSTVGGRRTVIILIMAAIALPLGWGLWRAAKMNR